MNTAQKKLMECFSLLPLTTEYIQKKDYKYALAGMLQTADKITDLLLSIGYVSKDKNWTFPGIEAITKELEK